MLHNETVKDESGSAGDPFGLIRQDPTESTCLSWLTTTLAKGFTMMQSPAHFFLSSPSCFSHSQIVAH
jgi:hypothetical protein